jgi:hypothetical protein
VGIKKEEISECLFLFISLKAASERTCSEYYIKKPLKINDKVFPNKIKYDGVGVWIIDWWK